MKKTTIKDLPLEVENLIPEKERTFLITNLIDNCREGIFHDFKSPETAPKMELLKDLAEIDDVRLKPIIDGVYAGDYDESPDEDDTEELKQSWLKGGGDEASWEAIFGGS